MKALELRALVSAGPAVVLVAKADMLALLDERDRLRKALALLERRASRLCELGATRGPQWIDLNVAILAALTTTRTEGGDDA